jgi:Secretion system C-terminal sorting domain
MCKFNWKSYALFILFIFVLSFSATSQNYLNETARWKQSFNYNGISTSTSCISERYFNGDTIIDGKKYYLLFYTDVCILNTRTFDSLGNPIIVSDTNNTTSFLTFIREENKRIYTRALLEDEFLRYNFDVPDNTPIDSVVKFTGCASSFVQILKHDTVCIGNIKRKSWAVSMSQFPLAQRIIEGVGPSSGFLSPICRNGCPECGYSLLSFSLNGDTLYKGNCIASGLDQLQKTDIRIYPNPCTDYLSIEADVPVLKYTIYKADGTLLAQQDVDNQGKEWSIDCREFPQGLYILKLHFENDILVRKFLK